MERMDVLVSNAMSNRKICELEATAYRLWLAQLVPANLILVVGAGLLSLVAGTSLLVDQEIISKTASGILALISSAFTLIHTRLGCDEHQAECRKLQSFYQGLAIDYANLETEANPVGFKAKIDSLNNHLAQAKKGSGAQPSMSSYTKARRLIEAKRIADHLKTLLPPTLVPLLCGFI
jgi:cell division protein FtsL